MNFKIYLKRRPLGHLLFPLLIIVFSCSLLNKVNAAGKSKSGMKSYAVQIPLDQQHNTEKIYELSYKTPFQYHYTPWVTRKLLLTLNMTSTNQHFFSLDQMNSVDTEDLDYDYECNDPAVLRKRKAPKLVHSINIDKFREETDIELNCYEKSFLKEIDRRQNKKEQNNWTNCNEFSKNTVKDICKEANEIADELAKKDLNEKAAHEKLIKSFNNYSLKHCSKMVLKDVISSVNRRRLLNQVTYNGTCENILSEIVQLDALVSFFSCEFDQILSRIYCQGYSVKETCDECSIAYKQWLCSMILPYHFEDLLVKPCLSICQRVERTCPYLHPEMKDQYGGEPIFICNDPDIPIAKNSIDEPYGKDRACFQKCHLEANHTLTMKSLLIKSKTATTTTEEPTTPQTEEEDNEDALQENPDLEVCITRENIVQKLRQVKVIKEDNEAIEQRKRLENATKNEKMNQSKRDLYAKWSNADGYISARMVDQIELEEEEIVEEVNKESTLEEDKHPINDDVYYLDSNNSLTNEEFNQTNNSASTDKPLVQQNNEQSSKDKKFHSDQRQENNFHFSVDDENDNEEGDSDLDQVISTTTMTSLNYAVNKQPSNHLDKKQ